jgi:hypothetical protein
MIKGKQTPNYSLRPEPTATLLFILVLVSGLLVTLSLFWQEDGSGVYRQRGIFAVIITGLLSFTFLLGATAKFWFTHLWKKNATHTRHSQHSSFHPVEKEKNIHTKFVKK